MSVSNDKQIIATEFALLRKRVGMTVHETGSFLGVAPNIIKSWNAGRNDAPRHAIEQMKALYYQIEDRASAIIEAQEAMIDEVGSIPECVEIGIPGSDLEAQEVAGFPTVSTMLTLAALVSVGCDIPIKLVRRGSTAATSDAINARMLGEANKNNE
ncbi:hypothetical protein [Ferrimicrobium acidiphilum]|uniref:hypothetical protein n=1 Tax=Ferrimicrobium acidiphilum TaxID=121039 RepID=UPI0023F1BE59|nr:hypothetical protein [Ferrimicrobium acidiphilum]